MADIRKMPEGIYKIYNSISSQGGLELGRNYAGYPHPEDRLKVVIVPKIGEELIVTKGKVIDMNTTCKAS